MSRTVARLPAGSRITDYISLGVVAKTFPLAKIHAALAATKREECAPARTSGPCDGLLRNRAGIVYAVVVPGSVALPVVGNPVVGGAGEHQRGR